MTEGSGKVTVNGIPLPEYLGEKLKEQVLDMVEEEAREMRRCIPRAAIHYSSNPTRAVLRGGPVIKETGMDEVVQRQIEVAKEIIQDNHASAFQVLTLDRPETEKRLRTVYKMIVRFVSERGYFSTIQDVKRAPDLWTTAVQGCYGGKDPYTKTIIYTDLKKLEGLGLIHPVGEGRNKIHRLGRKPSIGATIEKSYDPGIQIQQPPVEDRIPIHQDVVLNIIVKVKIELT